MKDFTKHPQENNKKLDQVEINEQRWSSRKRHRKNYLVAEKKAMASLKMQNGNVEASYHQLLKRVVALYSNLANKAERVVVEMNMKSHPLESHRMHAFLTPSFAFHLECDVLNRYKVEYCFENCPFEEQIKQMFARHFYNAHTLVEIKKPSYKAYFDEVLRVQPERFIRLL
ncbi:hypothetical protein [Pedobacter namyangjuensis]|uniref:hypothetical protein n=1 Tax=Pedobacter namyangjuensis TaxID=600626 RepID=UPI000DE36802|nr:hypothetical protein [Pedobacter namyangjuensis]